MSESLPLQRTYRFRVNPTPEQAQALARFAGTRRWIWNWALVRKRGYYAEQGKGISFAQLCAELTALKDQPETAWLQEIDSQLLQQALRDLERAFQNFFAKRARYPRVKSKKRGEPSFRIPQRVIVRDGQVYVPKIGWIALRQHRPIDGTTKSATWCYAPLRDQAGRDRPLVRHTGGGLQHARRGPARPRSDHRRRDRPGPQGLCRVVHGGEDRGPPVLPPRRTPYPAGATGAVAQAARQQEPRQSTPPLGARPPPGGE